MGRDEPNHRDGNREIALPTLIFKNAKLQEARGQIDPPAARRRPWGTGRRYNGGRMHLRPTRRPRLTPTVERAPLPEAVRATFAAPPEFERSASQGGISLSFYEHVKEIVVLTPTCI